MGVATLSVVHRLRRTGGRGNSIFYNVHKKSFLKFSFLVNKFVVDGIKIRELKKKYEFGKGLPENNVERKVFDRQQGKRISTELDIIFEGD